MTKCNTASCDGQPGSEGAAPPAVKHHTLHEDIMHSMMIEIKEDNIRLLLCHQNVECAVEQFSHACMHRPAFKSSLLRQLKLLDFKPSKDRHCSAGSDKEPEVSTLDDLPRAPRAAEAAL